MADRELFPREVTGNVPRVTLTGIERLHLEQHKGLIGYQPEEIVFRTSCGLMRIGGSGLRFASYSAQEALIVGRIGSIACEEAGGRG